MLITVKRALHDENATIGDLLLDGVRQCYTLEDQPQYGEKVPGETRIPATVTKDGRVRPAYRMTLQNELGLTKKYAKRYPDMHRGMLWIREIPDFTTVYIHTGNNDEHTEGCLLVGNSADKQRMVIGNSRDAYRALYPKVVDAAEAGTLEIDIFDEGATETRGA